MCEDEIKKKLTCYHMSEQIFFLHQVLVRSEQIYKTTRSRTHTRTHFLLHKNCIKIPYSRETINAK